MVFLDIYGFVKFENQLPNYTHTLFPNSPKPSLIILSINRKCVKFISNFMAPKFKFYGSQVLKQVCFSFRFSHNLYMLHLLWYHSISYTMQSTPLSIIACTHLLQSNRSWLVPTGERLLVSLYCIFSISAVSEKLTKYECGFRDTFISRITERNVNGAKKAKNIAKNRRKENKSI